MLISAVDRWGCGMGDGWTRRQFLARTGAAAAGATLLGGANLPGALAARRERGRIVGVDLSQHPYPLPPNLATVAELDQRWLDAQARRYWDEYASTLGRPLDKYDRADFWFRYIALPLQEKALTGGSSDPVKNRIERDLALMHLVGYFGGIWFFKKLEEFTGTDPRAQCGAPVPELQEADFEALTAVLRRLIDAGRGANDDLALDVAEDTLRDGTLLNQPDADNLPTRRGLIGGYSYNVGYTNAILVPDNRALPPPVNPAGPPIDTPPWNSFEFTPNGVFDATYPVWARAETQATTVAIPNPTFDHRQVPYLVGDAGALTVARPVFEAAQAEHPDGYLRVSLGAQDRYGNPVARGELSTLAQLGFNTGTATWTAPGLLDIRNWDAPSYHLIVALSIYFVQALQAPGQVNLAASAAQDPALARKGLMATAIAMPFGGSYLLGAGQRFNEHYACRDADESVPPLVLADGTRV
jgi:hypothetical protein